MTDIPFRSMAMRRVYFSRSWCSFSGWWNPARLIDCCVWLDRKCVHCVGLDHPRNSNTTDTRYRCCVKVWNSSAVKRHGFKLRFSAENIFQTISEYEQKICSLVDAKRITAEIHVLPIMPPHHEIQRLLQWKGSCMVRKALYYPMLIIIHLCFDVPHLCLNLCQRGLLFIM